MFNFVHSNKIKQLPDSMLFRRMPPVHNWLCLGCILLYNTCLTLFTQIKLSNSPTACVSEGCHQFTTDCVLVASCVEHLFNFVYSNKIKQLPIPGCPRMTLLHKWLCLGCILRKTHVSHTECLTLFTQIKLSNSTQCMAVAEGATSYNWLCLGAS